MSLSVLASGASGRENFASIDAEAWQWLLFLGVIVVLLLADLFLLHAQAREVHFREAAIESAVWIALGLSFGFVVAWWFGGQAAGEYWSGYLLEKSLSIDNVFVWAVIFSYFGVPKAYQFRTLFWGIFGALVLRAIFVFAGVALIERFDFVLYLFGGFLLITAWKIAHHDASHMHPDQNLALRAFRRLVPTTNHYDGQKLVTRVDGRRLATPLLAVLVLVESSDVVFAVDSIPAILAVSRESFIVFSSNAFAILGLRALYFCLAGMTGRFRYLNVGLGVILAFVGIKMLLSEVYHLPVAASLVVIALVLAVAIVVSMRADRRDAQDGAAT